MKAIAITPDDFPWYDYSRYSFSLGLSIGEQAYLSGHTASTFDPDVRRIVIQGGMADQARIAYAKVEAILKASGLSLGDAVRIVEYITDRGIDSYSEAEQIRSEIFGGHHPVVNTVPVRALLRADALIEIEVIAERKSDDLVFLPTIYSSDPSGDVVAQTDAIYDSAARMLEDLGLGLENVVKTVEYITPNALTDYKATATIRKNRLGPVYPAATGIIMPRLMHPGAMIQMDIIASRDTLKTVNPGWRHFDNLTYSPGVRAGDYLFMSGMTATDPNTGKTQHEGDVAAQADYIYRNILRVVAAAGGGAEQLVKTIEYTTPAALPNYRGVAEIRRSLLALPYPASTGPVCETLLRPEMLIEIDAFAILD